MGNNADKILFDNNSRVAPLGLIAMDGAKELGEKVNWYLTNWANENEYAVDTFLVEADCPRFSSGDGKGLIKQTVRGNDLFILCDVGNYNCKYKLFGQLNCMSLYGGRQHRRNYRESLDCAVALQELQAMGVSNILTFDAHDPRVQNAIPLMGFDNIIPSYQVLKAMFRSIEDFKPNKDHYMIVSPDEGAISRNMYYASILGVDLGMFYKRRDYSTIVNGRNPIVAHEYMGNDVTGKDIFVADDIISSGESMLDIAIELKKRKANRIFCYATYPIFTNGLEAFDKAYADGIIDGVFGTNLTYRTPELLSSPWFHEVDCAKYIAYYIASLNHDLSISNVIDPHSKIQALLKKYEIK